MQGTGYTLADPDFYAPVHRSPDPGRRYRPARVPTGWTGTDQTVWTLWHQGGATDAEQGWKVHVSARYERAQHVLDTVAGICFAEGVRFKHLSAALYFLMVHHKHGPRVQSGKFCAAYPVGVEQARRLMELLRDALRDEDGPYVLTDRRFADSRTVHYRYGAYVGRSRVRPDGTVATLVRDGHGGWAEDRRLPGFVLPAGVRDPFQPAGPEPDPSPGPVEVGGYTVRRVLQHSNAGGTYQATERGTGREVFLKEARAHNGLYWDGSSAADRLRREHATLLDLHRRAPGVAPEPFGYFPEWEHTFLATEFVPGRPLTRWTGIRSPMVQADRTPARYAAYYASCLHILDGVAAQLDRLHAAGYVFGDVNPANVLVDDDDRPRLVDFEAAAPLAAGPHRMGADGYLAPADLVRADPLAADAYGLSALALLLLAPLHQAAGRDAATLRHLRYELDEVCPVPERLWSLATRFHPAPAAGEGPGSGPRPAAAALPAPEDVAAEPRRHLAWLHDRIADTLLAAVDADHPDRVFPTVPAGYATNTTCVAYGTAGVVHALRAAGRDVPDAVVERLRKDALGARDTLPPGLHVGAAGIAWVLADLGLGDEAAALLAAADSSPLLDACATLGAGAAGVGTAHLAAYRRSGDGRHLDRAAALAAAIPDDGPDLTARLGAGDAVGLLHGRAGIALYLHTLAALTGDARHADRGLRLLHAELDRALDLPDGALSFPDSAITRRAMPYLETGSAGVLFAATRYLPGTGDERLAAAVPRMLADVGKPHTVLAGLYRGVAGLGLTLAEYAEVTGDRQAAAQAVRMGRALFKHAVPAPTGIHVHGDRMMRLSAELWSGSAGVLLFLARLLSGRRATFLTADFGTTPCGTTPCGTADRGTPDRGAAATALPPHVPAPGPSRVIR